MNQLTEQLYNLTIGRAQYLNITAKGLVEVLGETKAIEFLRTKVSNDIKAAAHAELSQHDWQYTRQLRNADSATPSPVTAEVKGHYDNVIAWTNATQQQLATLTVEALEQFEVTAPSL
jgi:hypothetical protein